MKKRQREPDVRRPLAGSSAQPAASHRRRARTAWLGGLFVVCACSCAGPDSELSPLEQAEAATRAQDWPLAAELWLEVHVSAAGRDLRAYYETARALNLAGDPRSACAMLRRGLEVFPNDLELLELSGTIQRECGFRRAAELAYLRITELDPTRVSAWRALAELRVELGLERAAEEPLLRAISLSGGDAGLYQRLGDVERLTGRPVLAFEAYDRATTFGPIDFESLVQAGELSLDHAVQSAQPGSLTKGRAWLERAVELDPQSTRAHFLLGRIAEEQQRDADAAVSYRRAVETDPACLEALTNLAVLYARMGDEVATADIVARALALETEPARRAALLELLGQSPQPPRVPR